VKEVNFHELNSVTVNNNNKELGPVVSMTAAGNTQILNEFTMSPFNTHQALAIKNIISCLFYFLQAFEVLQHSMLTPFKFSTSILNVDSK
jgi:hypothetical protein